MRPLLLVPLLLAACQAEPENIQAKSEDMARQLEERANQIQAEAENSVEAKAAPLENEADVLLNRISGNAADPGNSTGNASAAPPS
jgi:hypothetical protein